MALPGPAAVPCSSAVHIRLFADILCRLGVVVATAAFATSKLFGVARPNMLFASEPLQGCVWKPEVMAISAAWKGTIAAEKLLTSPLAAELELYRTAPSVADLRGLFGRAERASEHLVGYLAAAAVQFTEELTAELVKVTPAYSHYLTATKLSATLARKHLMAASVGEQLGTKTVALAQVYSATKAALADRAVGVSLPKPANEDEPSHEEAVMSSADHCLTTAKNALAVIAGCNILFVGGPLQAAEAKQLTAKPRPDMPIALWEALVAISAKAEAAGTVVAKAEVGAAAAASSTTAAP